ncbi:isoquinoline 1-oxidoreductase, beta subunit [Bradyrhizobium yuanmingense]|uniref:Isoquinoline 1-oxidoreductase, beta subunit n=1 Tax=Bradyrhizobium yuanmingense TaxID=108015 RepID=A0A1C3VIT9_9BRAD|nr:xanthine dehydrogenase family protein molybdopterin-binding subunit [Bradyrhizobium yuanmingense]TWI28456.1 isoquinoline 1-oxidoreductase beta subunit [Bradyrhizobium yuanmingense]SCB27555.1 isoquinoline 1-oxidoreductase, beta subunit [Bradyrhizobium yuanmingense]
MVKTFSASSSRLSRRQFLVNSAAAGGSLVLGFSLPVDGSAAAAAETFSPNAFIRVSRDGQVTLIMPYVEMGQGTYTSIPMLIAEELEVELGQIRLEHAPPDEKLYYNPLLGVQATGNSNAMRGAWKPLREAGAAARLMLIEAAAKRWGVDASSCHAKAGKVIHASGKTLSYGELVGDAARLTPPKAISLKTPDRFTLIGTSAKRLDLPGKVNGTALFGIDARPSGLKIATLAQSPVPGGRVKRVDDTAAKAIKGVRQIVRLDDAVAVVADHMGAAEKGLDALKIEWDDGSHAALTSEEVYRQLEQAVQGRGAVAQDVGGAEKAMASAAVRVTASYRLPFLAHATMEPMNCTAHVHDGVCELWLGTQAIARVQAAAAKTAGVPLEKVTVHNHLIGGGFGRRLETDGAVRAVQVAMQVDGPVKLIWTREEDIQHDLYRPSWVDRIEAGLDRDGRPLAWINRFAGSSVVARWLPPGFKDGIDPDSVDGAIDLSYAIPNVHVEYARVEPPGIQTGFWRSVGPSHNVFVTESFVDELAAAAKRDPLAYRRDLLAHNPKTRAVLDLAAEKSGWGTPLPQRWGRGVSLQKAFGSLLVQVAEVEVAKDGSVRVHRVVCAMDCGTVINPDTVEAQIQSGVMFGVTAALYGEITLNNGRVEQGNFDTYQMLRINEAPAIEVHLVSSTEPPGGMGEAGTSGIVPAIANAVFAATGKRLRQLPIDPALLKT